jgi:hypothetical protein
MDAVSHGEINPFAVIGQENSVNDTGACTKKYAPVT